MLIIMVLGLCLSAVIYDHATLMKTVKTRVKVIYFIILSMGLILLILNSLQISVPSPTDEVIKVLDAVFHIKK